MDKFQTLQDLCQLGVVVFTVLAVISGFGAYRYGIKKDEVIRNQAKDTAIKIKEVSNDSNNIKSGSKSKVKQNIVKQNITINAPNSLITTQNQSGGSNTINYSGGKFNPANISQKPLFDETGNYGTNLLNDNVIEITQGTFYSFAVKIPLNSVMKVALNKIGDDKKSLWSMSISKKRNWIYTTYSEGQQIYTLDEEMGDLEISFKESGSAKMQIFFNGELLKEKVISWK